MIEPSTMSQMSASRIAGCGNSSGMIVQVALAAAPTPSVKWPVGRPIFFFFSSRRRHTRWPRDWSSRRVLFRSALQRLVEEQALPAGREEQRIDGADQEPHAKRLVATVAQPHLHADGLSARGGLERLREIAEHQ